MTHFIKSDLDSYLPSGTNHLQSNAFIPHKIIAANFFHKVYILLFCARFSISSAFNSVAKWLAAHARRHFHFRW